MSIDNKRLIELTSSFKNKDYSGFDEFYEMTKKNLYFSIYAVVKNHTATEDLLQDTYVKFLNNVDSIKDDTNPLGYLLIIARNASLDYIKSRKREINYDEYDNEGAYGGQNDEYQFEEESIFKKAEAILKPKEFEILILHLVNDMTFDEISKHLSRPLGTILWSYNNSIKKLRKGVSKNG